MSVRKVSEIVTTPDFISDDPVRRYFETEFAANFLHENLKDIDQEELDDLIQQNLSYLKDKEEFDLITQEFLNNFSKQARLAIHQTLNGTPPAADAPASIKKYSDAISKIKLGTGYYKNFSLEERIKIEQLINLSFLSVKAAIYHHKILPIKIYEKGLYTPNNRGIIKKPDQKKVTSQNMGLIKSYHPLARDDIYLNDMPTQFTRATESSRFNPESLWVKMNFSKLVHPFSNSISGTMLSQLRMLKSLHNKRKFKFQKTNCIKYLHTLASAMLFNSGGHSYYEFLHPLTLDDVKIAFEPITSDIADYNIVNIIDSSGINRTVLGNTLDYFYKIELKNKLHSELAISSFNRVTNQAFKNYGFNLKQLEKTQLLQPENIQRVLDTPPPFISSKLQTVKRYAIISP
ncbi:hypothetical protein [Piscirickettsia salmonis]|uniref:hypothetical protein n=1 Tax=Piscirickettsia salmonis TaxID=1238 RepID=UPI0012BA6095|nr:hypothetical protein [Piscirickettsia salmonis]QGP39260.1 hypothetical protein Psal182_01402 [Piscirickettsia salmonis]